MTPEAQRIAIAEACGWHIETTQYFKVLRKPHSYEGGFCCGLHLTDEEVWNAGLTGDENGDFKYPDYLYDLNAMHEAEKILAEKELQSTYYLQELPKVCLGPLAHATAAQRAEAFLRTIGKWID